MLERPNVILITCDQLRGDSLGCYGHPVVETPHLDQLAGEGIRFTQAYTACPSCIAARAGILTGMIPRHHGRVGYKDGIPFEYEFTLPGELARAGYHTQGIGKMHFCPPRNLCGFHHVVLHDGYLLHERKAPREYALVDDYLPWLQARLGNDADMILHGLDCNSWVARPWPYHESVHPTTWATTQAIDFLRRRDPTKPFFMWLSYVRPHPPLDPPAVYYDQYARQDLPVPPVGDWADRESLMTSVKGRFGAIGERQLHRARAAYFAQITHIDHQIGRLMAYLKEYGVMDNTYIVFTSDHGELLGDHNLFKKSLPYDGSARIPLLLRAPRGYPYEPGRVVDAPVELRDIMPTILEACGVAIPATVDGCSLAPLAGGEKVTWREYVHGEHELEDGTRHLSNHYITTGKVKYIWFSHDGREQLFNLADDPRELHNLAVDPAFEVDLAWCRARLIAELTGREEGYTDGKRLIPGKQAKIVLQSVES